MKMQSAVLTMMQILKEVYCFYLEYGMLVDDLELFGVVTAKPLVIVDEGYDAAETRLELSETMVKDR